MKLRVLPDNVRYRTMSSEELRQSFVIDDLFTPGELTLTYCSEDRTIVGSAVPLERKLSLTAADELRAQYFCERRELGVLNIGGAGSVEADGTSYSLEKLDCLYIGRGTKSVSFSSAQSSQPAQFYLVSYPAHAQYPSAFVATAAACPVSLGSSEQANQRTIRKYIHAGGVKSCQLVMGVTTLASGSVWNTMPPHTHQRRSEIYLYFDIAADGRVFHLMGEAEETRHLVVADRQAVIAPSWSIHSGVGTSAYTFCWGMGGENQAFDDMDAVPASTLK